jgi:membrane fusion protein, multidrug efflux system
MADIRTVTTTASVAIALLCAAWAIYAGKHSPSGSSGPPDAARAPGSQSGGSPGARGPGIAVVTSVATRQQIDVGLEAIGTANANEAVSITSKTSNLVTAIRFRDGQAVSTGQVLVELDHAQAGADLAAATADYNESVSQFNRSREMLAIQALSKAQAEQLESTMKANEARVASARARAADTYIRAPFAGHVGLRRISVGTLISPGTVITTLDDSSSMKIDFSVPDIYLAQLQPGQSIAAHAAAYPGRDFAGKVSSVDSRVDPVTRSVTVRALVPNRDAALKSGMFLTVVLATEKRNALMIAEEALVPEQARQFVYVLKGNAVAKREVRLGRRERGRVEIAEGLVEGERIVVEGTLKLRDGAIVRELAAPRVAPAPAGS